MKRWHKLKWWHANRGMRQTTGKIIMLGGALPEVDLSRTAVGFSIPEVDNSAMTDTRRKTRVRM